MAPIEIGYWKIRGLGAPLRMLCEYAGLEYEDKQYASGAEWFGEAKPRILEMNPLANLPYVFDPATKLCVCQSNACLLYLAEKAGLHGASFEEKMQIQQLIDEAMDIRNHMISIVYPFKKANRDKAEFEASARDAIDKDAPNYYKKLETILERGGKKYFVRDELTVAEFHIWEMLDQFEKLATTMGKGSALAAFPKLKALYESFRAEPKLQKYFASEAYTLPCNSPLANAYFV